jgi:hypothetical protein
MMIVFRCTPSSWYDTALQDQYISWRKSMPYGQRGTADPLLRISPGRAIRPAERNFSQERPRREKKIVEFRNLRSEITEQLSQSSSEDVIERLVPLIYGELREMAHRELLREYRRYTLQTTSADDVCHGSSGSRNERPDRPATDSMGGRATWFIQAHHNC